MPASNALLSGQRLIKYTLPPNLSSVFGLYAPRKAQKPLWNKIIASAVFFAFLAIPVLGPVHALSLSRLFQLSTKAGAAVFLSDVSVADANSQTMTLLSPAVNIDPAPARGGGDIVVVGGAALSAQAGPEGTAADIEEWPSSSQISVYTVREGDTLSEIAGMFNVTVNTIVWANEIKNNTIKPGQTLIILPVVGVRHTVVKGETLSSLAKKFSADAGDIANFNGLEDGAKLAVGDIVIIPNGEMPVSSVVSSSGRITTVPPEPYRGGSGPDLADYFGWPTRTGVVTQTLHGWNAVDIGAPKGTPIMAAANGVVIVVRHSGWNGGYGSYVVLQHGNGTQTLYAHASAVLVSVGENVVRGQNIALMGSTGLSTGSHLHFEIRGAKNPLTALLLGARVGF